LVSRQPFCRVEFHLIGPPQAAREAQAWMRMFERLMELFVDLAKFRAELGDGPGGGTAKRAHRLAASLQHAVLTLIDRVWAARAQAPACD
jgi:hypothetical protein